MPQPYSEDLRWQVIWMKEFLRYKIDEVAAALLSPKTILFYVSKFLNSGEVKAETLGQLLNSFLMHPHVEFNNASSTWPLGKNPLRNCTEYLWTDRVRTCSFEHIAIFETTILAEKGFVKYFLSVLRFDFSLLM